jgi:hypothetical protein
MKQKRKIISGLFLTCFCLPSVYGQETTSAAGSDATGSGGSLSYTIGQITYTTNSDPSYSISQGVQQPYEILVLSGIDENYGIQLSFSVYPNPAFDMMTLKAENSENAELSYLLFDLNGKLLQGEEMTQSEKQISMIDYPAGNYFLSVVNGGFEVKTFKIIKN